MKLTRLGYQLPLTEENERQVKRYLIHKPVQKFKMDYGPKPNPIHNYRKSEKFLYIPRYYGIQNYGPPIEDLTGLNAVKINSEVKFEGKLRSTQEEMVNATKKQFKTDVKGGIWHASTGVGKTFAALYMIAELGLKTLVVVNKEVLKRQWFREIKKVLPKANIGLIQADKQDVEDKDIIVGMLQSISKRNYNAKIYDDISFIIIDECFPYKQKIITENGHISIGTLYNIWKNEPYNLPKVLSYNENTKTAEYKRIIYAWEKYNNSLIELTYNSGSIQCTEKHRILTPIGYIEANKLNVGDLIKCNYGTVTINNIQRIKNYDNKNRVYDIEVEDNHNFILSTVNDVENGPVVHNCHNIGSTFFSQLLFKVQPKYRLGLSATPKRKDGMEKVFEEHLGPTIIQVNNLTVEPKIQFISIRDLEDNIKPSLTRQGRLNMSRLITDITKSKKRNQLIIREVLKLLQNKRKLIVFSDRVQQCKLLDHVTRETISKYPQLSKFTSSVFIGGMKDEEYDLAKKCDVLFATYSLAKEGFDHPTLDSCILATPKSDVVQVIGRILRQKNDNFPLVVDLVDRDFQAFTGMYYRRRNYYKKQGYEFLPNLELDDEMKYHEEGIDIKKCVIIEEET